MKYVWIKEHGDAFPVNAMCRVLGVSTSGYYKSLTPAVSQRAERSRRIRDEVRQIFNENHQVVWQLQDQEIDAKQ